MVRYRRHFVGYRGRSRSAGVCHGRDSRGVPGGLFAFDSSTGGGVLDFGCGSGHLSLVVVLRAGMTFGHCSEMVRPPPGA